MKRKVLSRVWVLGLGVLVLAVSLTSGDRGLTPRAADATSHPIRIGLLYGITGFAAIYNKPAIHGHEVALAEINEAGGVLGRKLQYALRDDKTNPEVAVRMANELVLREKVDFLMGTLASHVSLAVSEVARKNKILYLATIPKTEALTSEKGHRYVFRVASNTLIEGRQLAELEKTTPATRYYTIANDYEYGRKVVEAFVDHVKKVKPRAQIVGQGWPKLGETEWTPFITAILAAKPEVVLNFVYGDMFIAFVKQAKPYGYFEKVRVISGAEVVSTEMAVPLGKDMPEGILGNAYDVFYWPDTAEHRKFVKAYLDKTGEAFVPGWAIQGYIGTYFLAEAIKKAGTTDTEKVIAAMEGLTLKTPIGPVTMRAYDHQANRGQVYGLTTHSADYPFAILKDVKYLNAEGFWRSVEEIKALRGEK
ncbi:MAG: ABC transporter substrate-binding protein [Candidatus Rokubacteria bacterium]|nr:ABC transporter substrate-binding protein [Candidatus Rokubacteria bacterium]